MSDLWDVFSILMLHRNNLLYVFIEIREEVNETIKLCKWIAGSSLRTAPRITEDPSDVTVMRNDPATLRCSFTGDPAPEVTWYRDGEALEPRGHRLVLPDGALFFLRVSQGRGRNGGDAGTYWCVARNSLGVARSRNATLTVACKSISTYSIVNN